MGREDSLIPAMEATCAKGGCGSFSPRQCFMAVTSFLFQHDLTIIYCVFSSARTQESCSRLPFDDCSLLLIVHHRHLLFVNSL